MKFEGFDRVGDTMIISVLFVLGCLPVITIGASFTAMFHATRYCRTQRGYAARNFIQGFKSNLKKATLVWLVFMAMIAFLCVDFLIVTVMSNIFKYAMMVGLTIIAAVVAAAIPVAFQLTARFENTVGNTVKNACILCVVNPIQALLSAVVFLVPIVLMILLPGLFVLLLAVWVGLLYGASGLFSYMLFLPALLKLQPSK